MTYVPMAQDMEAEDGLPLVADRRQGNTGLWVFAAICLLGGWLLFSALNDRREASQLSAMGSAPGEADVAIASPPPLQLPAEWTDTPPQPAGRPVLLQRNPPPRAQPAPPVHRPAVPPMARPQPPAGEASSPPAALDPPAPRIVYDGSRDARPIVPGAGQRGLVEEGRVVATRFANPSFTVPRGTVIPAVLETAIDSTRPGAVRALVQRDVKGFDGTRVLIQRGSRLFGEYEGGIAQGQDRALVRWTRLIRPDGVVINLDSPAADPLGRAGIKGDVDTHFWTRFGNALLGSAFTVGSTVAQGAITGGAVVVQSGQQAAQTPSSGVQPTLRVDHGTSVSVFVAQDLDFSEVDR